MAEPDTDLEAEFYQRRTELEAALAYAGNSHSLADIWELIKAGKMQLWLADHSLLVTEVLEYPRYRAIHFFLGAGRLDELEVLYPAAVNWAVEEQGCSKASLTGRPGWSRSFLLRDGWRATHVVMTKDL